MDQPFLDNKLLTENNDLLSSRDAATPKPSKEALQYITAPSLAKIDKPSCPKPRIAVARAYKDLDELWCKSWSEIENKFRILEQTELMDARKDNRSHQNRVGSMMLP